MLVSLFPPCKNKNLFNREKSRRTAGELQEQKHSKTKLKTSFSLLIADS
jgi:hypothetical protein